MSVISVFSRLGRYLLSGGCQKVRNGHLSIQTVTFTKPRGHFPESVSSKQPEMRHTATTGEPDRASAFVLIHSRANPESKPPCAWTNLINSRHLLTHPALSFSSLIRWLSYKQWLINEPWSWIRHRTSRGLCFPPSLPSSTLDQPYLCKLSTRLLITTSLAMHW